MTTDITVAFLARGAGGGVGAVEAFLTSYVKFSAGAPHKLVFLTKGWGGLEGRERVDVLAAGVGAEVIDLPDDGYDWGAYFRLAEIAQTEFLFFLNTHSRIIRGNWVAYPYAHIRRPEIGLVGCTASYGSRRWNWALPLYQVQQRWHEHEWFKATALAALVGPRYLRFLASRRRQFPPFPNPHIRSNAFMIRTSDFREFARTTRIPLSKHEAYLLEFSDKGMSRFIQEKRLGLVLCGADGVAHLPEKWPDSGVFCCPGQSNLLIEDNVTQFYQNASETKKRELEVVLWGRPFG